MNLTQIDSLRPDVAGAIRDNIGWIWELYHAAGQRWQALEAAREAIDNCCGLWSSDPDPQLLHRAVQTVTAILEQTRQP